MFPALSSLHSLRIYIFFSFFLLFEYHLLFCCPEKGGPTTLYATTLMVYSYYYYYFGATQLLALYTVPGNNLSPVAIMIHFLAPLSTLLWWPAAAGFSRRVAPLLSGCSIRYCSIGPRPTKPTTEKRERATASVYNLSYSFPPLRRVPCIPWREKERKMKRRRRRENR